jgi:hypothetical protein
VERYVDVAVCGIAPGKLLKAGALLFIGEKRISPRDLIFK